LFFANEAIFGEHRFRAIAASPASAEIGSHLKNRMRHMGIQFWECASLEIEHTGGGFDDFWRRHPSTHE
jgi:hypothetical protein